MQPAPPLAQTAGRAADAGGVVHAVVDGDALVNKGALEQVEDLVVGVHAHGLREHRTPVHLVGQDDLEDDGRVDDVVDAEDFGGAHDEFVGVVHGAAGDGLGPGMAAAAGGGHGLWMGGVGDMRPKAGCSFLEVMFEVVVGIWDCWEGGFDGKTTVALESIEAVRYRREVRVLYQRSNAPGIC